MTKHSAKKYPEPSYWFERFNKGHHQPLEQSNIPARAIAKISTTTTITKKINQSNSREAGCINRKQLTLNQFEAGWLSRNRRVVSLQLKMKWKLKLDFINWQHLGWKPRKRFQTTVVCLWRCSSRLYNSRVLLPPIDGLVFPGRLGQDYPADRLSAASYPQIKGRRQKVGRSLVSSSSSTSTSIS